MEYIMVILEVAVKVIMCMLQQTVVTPVPQVSTPTSSAELWGNATSPRLCPDVARLSLLLEMGSSAMPMNLVHLCRDQISSWTVVMSTWNHMNYMIKYTAVINMLHMVYL